MWEARNTTIGTTNADELYGGVIYVTGAATLTIDCANAATFTGVISGTGSVDEIKERAFQALSA